MKIYNVVYINESNREDVFAANSIEQAIHTIIPMLHPTNTEDTFTAVIEVDTKTGQSTKMEPVINLLTWKLDLKYVPVKRESTN